MVRWNIRHSSQSCKIKMRRPYKTANTEVGARLQRAIEQHWGSHQALAAHTGIKTGTITKYVRHGRLPAGEVMVKLAMALPGDIEYILTGRRPTELEERTVGSLPPPLQEVVQRGLELSPDLQKSLAQCARVIASGEDDLIDMLTGPARLLENTVKLRQPP